MSKAVRLNPKQFAAWEEERKKEPTETVFNPITGQAIKVGGPTYLKIEQTYQKMIQRQVQKQTLAPIKEEGFDQLSKVLNIVAQRSKPNIAAKIATIIPDNPYLYGVTTPTKEHVRERAQVLRSQKPGVFLDEASTKELIMEVAEMTQQDEIEISESEKIRLKMGIKSINVQPPNREVIFYIQNYLASELKKIRDLTRSQTVKALLKTGNLSTRRPETYDTVLDKLKKWSERLNATSFNQFNRFSTLSLHDRKTIYELVVKNLERYSKSPLSSEETLVDAVYNAYDVPKDIASIYAFYIKYLLYIKLYDAISYLKTLAENNLTAQQRIDRRQRGEKTAIILTIQSLSNYMRGGKKTKKNVSKK